MPEPELPARPVGIAGPYGRHGQFSHASFPFWQGLASQEAHQGCLRLAILGPMGWQGCWQGWAVKLAAAVRVRIRVQGVLWAAKRREARSGLVC